VIINQKDLFSVVNKLLQPEGYTKKGNAWYLHTSECICFFLLEKSPFAGRYEDLMGCLVKKLAHEEDEFPKYYKKNLGYTLEYFIGKKRARELFDLESRKYQNSERENEIKEIILRYVLPFLKDVSSVEGISKAINKYKDLRYYIDGELSELIEALDLKK